LWLGFVDATRGAEIRRRRYRPDAVEESVRLLSAPSGGSRFCSFLPGVPAREEFDEPVDRIVSIEAFEAFPKERYAAFFETCYRILPARGRMVLQTIMGHPLKRWPDMGIPITISDLKFMRFIAKEIFPGGAVPCDEDIVEFSGGAGFSVEQTRYLNEHYVRTLDAWATNLEAARDDAVAATSTEVYERYMRYLTGCSDFFRRGISELGQFTLTKG
jgi:cyclopropane-fatty-acyl-phospholipid synthase